MAPPTHKPHEAPMFTSSSDARKRRLTSFGAVLFAAVLGLVTAGQAAAQVLEPRPTPGAERRAKATILIHGLQPGWPPRPAPAAGGRVTDLLGWEQFRGHNCTDYWREWRGALPQANATGIPVLTMALYRNSAGCGATLVGMSNAQFGSAGRYAYAGNTLDGSPTDAREWMDTNIPIWHLGYRLAWYIYSNYTVRGESVNLIGHSMGGLVIRAAVGGTHSRLDGFPPRLLVNTLVTVASPNGGVWPAAICGSNTVRIDQCDDMAPGSEFIRLVNAADTTHSGVAKRLHLRASGDLLSSQTMFEGAPATAGTNVDYWTPGRWLGNSDADLHGGPRRDLRLDRTDSMDWTVVRRNATRTSGSNGQRGAPGRGTGGVPGTADGFYSLIVRRINQTTPDP